MAGAAVPSEGKAIGWRVGTYWAESAAFYEGEVVGYDNASGRHHLVYDGGEQEHVLLTSVKVRCWDYATTSTAAVRLQPQMAAPCLQAAALRSRHGAHVGVLLPKTGHDSMDNVCSWVVPDS